MIHSCWRRQTWSIYADDAALMCVMCASNPQQLQNLINSFVAYCDKHGLTVNPSKCEVVVFAKIELQGMDWVW